MTSVGTAHEPFYGAPLGNRPRGVDRGQQERIAANEVRFREANEQIKRTATELGFDAPVPFICECGDARCTEFGVLTLEQYEVVRAEPTHFLVVSGHESVAGPAGRVVQDGTRFKILEKVDVAAEVAKAHDPRRSAPG